LVEAGGVGWAHLGPVRIPPVEFGLDQWPNVDTVDGQVHDFAVHVNVGQFDAAHHNAAHVNAAEPGARQIAGAKLRAAQIDAVEPRVPQILTEEVSHGSTVASACRRSAGAGPAAVSSHGPLAVVVSPGVHGHGADSHGALVPELCWLRNLAAGLVAIVGGGQLAWVCGARAGEV
jgi:hypothetical protein